MNYQYKYALRACDSYKVNCTYMYMYITCIIMYNHVISVYVYIVCESGIAEW